MAYFFAGIKNTSFGNVYTILKLLITIFQAICLRSFIFAPSVQISVLFSLSLGSVLIALIFRPMDSKYRNFNEILSMFVYAVIIGIYLFCFCYSWPAGSDYPRAVLAWISIGCFIGGVFYASTLSVVRVILMIRSENFSKREILCEIEAGETEVKKISTDNDIESNAYSREYKEIANKASKKIHLGSLGDLARGTSFDIRGAEDISSFSLAHGRSMENIPTDPQQKSQRSFGLSQSTRLDEESIRLTQMRF